eukprot:12484067-Prorocentrum_lima.AAC.1
MHARRGRGRTGTICMNVLGGGARRDGRTDSWYFGSTGGPPVAAVGEVRKSCLGAHRCFFFRPPFAH